MSFFPTLAAKTKSNLAVRFVVIGVFNTGFSYLIYAGFLFVGFTYQLGNLFALVLGILISFKTQGHFVFNNTNNRLLGRFVLSWAFIYVCIVALIGQIISLGLDAYTAGALSLPVSVGLSYLTQKYYVFRRTTKGSAGIDEV